jgi:antitoxin component of MazEF toxin-antitoxin module
VKTIALSLAQIGNSRGVRLPAGIIRKHGFERGLVLEDRGHEIALKPKAGPKKLSWEETYREMAVADEDWSEWDGTVADGLEDIPWEGPIPRKARRVKRSAAKLGDARSGRTDEAV